MTDTQTPTVIADDTLDATVGGVSILTGLLLPAVNKVDATGDEAEAKGSARHSGCANNLRQLSL